MKQFTWIPKILLSGLLLAQMLFTLPVYQSNRHLFHTTTAIDAAGYLAIPNLKMLPALNSITTAFMGGLFFTVTLGAGLTVSAFACAWLWDRVLGRQNRFLLLFLIPWGLCLIALNAHGLILSASAGFLLIPPAVFFFTLKWLPPQSARNPLRSLLLHLTPPVVLALAGFCGSGTHPFINIRDVFLLSNPAGIAINDFYYRYSLYPARVFKTLDQKTLKTCRLENIPEKMVRKQIENRLLRYDYLPVDHFEQVDLTLRKEVNNLVFKSQGGDIFRCPMGEFMANPGSLLKKFSATLDRYGLFRQLTFISLLAGLPVLIYTLTLCALQVLFFLAGLPPGRSLMVSLGLILMTGLVLPIWLNHFSGRVTTGVQNPILALGSDHLHIRLAALKTIGARHLNLTAFQNYTALLKSPHIAERYWAARALGTAGDRKNSALLLTLLDDPHPNVVCQAFYGLGQNNDKTVVPDILNRIRTSDHWYVQWYAYRAARKLTWKQTVLR